MPRQQPELSGLQFAYAGVVEWPFGPFDLHANELGPLPLAVFVEPVGVNEARQVVAGLLGDGPEERLVRAGLRLADLPLFDAGSEFLPVARGLRLAFRGRTALPETLD